MDIYFDDFKVTHELNDIVAGGDYYPFGSVMTGREITRDEYRFGYQGQFAEKDEETGWNAFELRMYAPVIGRWMIADPKRQYYSLYLGMGNNPINSVDSDGGWRSSARAERMRNQAVDQGLDPGPLYKSGDHWGFNTMNAENAIVFNHKFFGATNHELWFNGSIEANGHAVSGTLEWWINYGEFDWEMSESWQARSGSSYVNGIQSGGYTANFLRYRDGRLNPNGPEEWNTANNRMTRDGLGFSLNIVGSSDPLHRIHPDGNALGNWQVNDGTLGCIGVQCDQQALKIFEHMANTYLRNHTAINLIVTGGH
jgi:RHS repeat-associated protein